MPPRPTYFFKDSPFFEIRELVLSNITLDASPTHRATISRNLTLNENQSGRLKTDPSLRLLLFSALEQPLAPYSRLDIAFPSQIEVRVNDDEVKANYKGLKNKPGSTRPADITDFVRTKVANQRNSILITYALTQKASQLEVSYLVSPLKRDLKLILKSRDTTCSSTWSGSFPSRNSHSASNTATSSPGSLY